MDSLPRCAMPFYHDEASLYRSVRFSVLTQYSGVVCLEHWHCSYSILEGALKVLFVLFLWVPDRLSKRLNGLLLPLLYTLFLVDLILWL